MKKPGEEEEEEGEGEVPVDVPVDVGPRIVPTLDFKRTSALAFCSSAYTG
jgi:hypothetical protein